MQPKRTKLSTLHQKREIDWQQKKKNIYDKKCINVILFYFFLKKGCDFKHFVYTSKHMNCQSKSVV